MKVQTQFSAHDHGFRFGNRFDFSFEFDLPLIGKVDFGDIIYGLCGGMCFAALDHFFSGKPLPTYASDDDIPPAYHNYLRDRQLDSMALPVVPKVIEWSMRSDTELSKMTARTEIPKIRRSLDKGTPTVLALIRVHGVGDLTKNHQVLVIGYNYDATTKDMTLHLYDPNHPQSEPTISLNLSRPSQGINPQQSTGEPLRGFFVIRYQQQAPPAS